MCVCGNVSILLKEILSLVLIRFNQNLFFFFFQSPSSVASNNVVYASEQTDKLFAQMVSSATKQPFCIDAQNNRDSVVEKGPNLVIKMEIKEEMV